MTVTAIAICSNIARYGLTSSPFDKIIMIPGNHDLFYRDQRTISSIAWAEHIPNIEIINELAAIKILSHQISSQNSFVGVQA